MDHTTIATEKQNSSHLEHLYVVQKWPNILSETVFPPPPPFTFLLQINIADIVPEVMVDTSDKGEQGGHHKEEEQPQQPRGDPVMGPILKTLVAEWKRGDAVLLKQGP